MKIVLQILFFVAFTVAMKAMFDPDLNARLVAFEPIGNLPVLVREVALHVPYALIAALLLTRAEVWPRLPGMMSLHAPLAAMLALMLMSGTMAQSSPVLALIVRPFAVLLLVANLVMVLTRLTPKPGFVYEGSGVPSVKLFLAAMLTLALSIDLAAPIANAAGFGAVLEKVPAVYLNLAIGAVIAAAYIVASGVRFRTLQPNSASAWMSWGIALWVIAQLLEPAITQLRTYGFQKERGVAEFILHASAVKAGLEIVAHALLFIGCFTLLSHLLPERDRVARQ